MATVEAEKYDPVPAGFELVTAGVIQKDDLVWDDFDYEWAVVGKEEIGDEAGAYLGVARKT